jgi:5-methylcytosine-specific restriction endonuclease McrA
LKSYQQTPEYKAKAKVRQQTPEFKAKRNTRGLTPAEKAKAKVRQQTPEYKAVAKARNQTPEAKAAKKIRDRGRRRNGPRTTAYKARKNAKQKASRQTAEGKARLKVSNKTPNARAARATINARRRGRQFGAEGSYTTQKWNDLKEHFGNRCLRCGYHESELTTVLERDHVIPISKGGSNWITNIQPLCKDCNGPHRKWANSFDYRPDPNIPLFRPL